MVSAGGLEYLATGGAFRSGEGETIQETPPSAFRHPPSAFRLPPSAFRLPPSAICHPTPVTRTPGTRALRIAPPRMTKPSYAPERRVRTCSPAATCSRGKRVHLRRAQQRRASSIAKTPSAPARQDALSPVTL